MSAQIHVNQYLLREVTAERNPNNADIVSVTLDQAAGGHMVREEIAAVESVWQQVADRLAAIGIVGHVERAAVPLQGVVQP